jgi:hypothetical protein
MPHTDLSPWGRVHARPEELRVSPTHSGAQHSFDLFKSVRFETCVDAIEAFAAWIRSEHDTRKRQGVLA